MYYGLLAKWLDSMFLHVFHHYCSGWPVHSTPITVNSVGVIVLFPFYLKSIQMTIPRNEVWKCESRTSERCKNKIHWDVNVSLIEGEDMGQDKWSELIKWDEMSQPLRHLGVDFISPSRQYIVVSTNQPQVTTASAVMMGSMSNNRRKKINFL